MHSAETNQFNSIHLENKTILSQKYHEHKLFLERTEFS